LVEQNFASTNHYEWLQSATQAQAANKSLAACVLMIRLEMKEDLRQKNVRAEKWDVLRRAFRPF
jgi:hypothetical protein